MSTGITWDWSKYGTDSTYTVTKPKEAKMSAKVTLSPSLGQFGVDGYFVKVNGEVVGLVGQWECRTAVLGNHGRSRIAVGYRVRKYWKSYLLNGTRKVGVYDYDITRKEAIATLMAKIG